MTGDASAFGSTTWSVSAISRNQMSPHWMIERQAFPLSWSTGPRRTRSSSFDSTRFGIIPQFERQHSMALNVGQRIIGGFGLVIALTFGLGWYQLFNIEKMKDQAVELADVDFEALRLVRHLEIERREMAINFENAWAAYFLKKAGAGTEDPFAYQKEWEFARERLASLGKQFDDFVERQQNVAINDEERQIWLALRNANKALQQTVEESANVSRDLFDLIKQENFALYAGYHDTLVQQRKG